MLHSLLRLWGNCTSPAATHFYNACGLFLQKLELKQKGAKQPSL